MVNVIPTITIATNAMTISNLSRMKGRGSSGSGSGRLSKPKKTKEISALLKEKFEEAWNRQEKRLSKFKSNGK